MLKRSAAALTYEHTRLDERIADRSILGSCLTAECNNVEVTASGGFSVLRSEIGWLHLVTVIFRYHWAGIIIVTASVCLCLRTGFVHKQIVDGSFFKALGMLLAVLLSVRARNGVGRRQHVMGTVLNMGARARDILQLAADDCRLEPLEEECLRRRDELRLILEYVFAKIAYWFEVRELRHGSDEDTQPNWQGPLIEDLPSHCRKAAMRLGSMLSLGMSPRPLFYYVREVCDRLWDPHEDAKFDRISNIRRWHKQIDIEINGLIRHFDDLATFQEEIQPRQMTWLIAGLICLYTSLYPWCVQDESGPVLAATTLGMCFVFYGLNALTCEIEDPLLRCSHGFNLSLIFQQLFRNLECEEALQVRCRSFMRDFDASEVSEDTRQRFVGQELATHGPFYLGGDAPALQCRSLL